MGDAPGAGAGSRRSGRSSNDPSAYYNAGWNGDVYGYSEAEAGGTPTLASIASTSSGGYDSLSGPRGRLGSGTGLLDGMARLAPVSTLPPVLIEHPDEDAGASGGGLTNDPRTRRVSITPATSQAAAAALATSTAATTADGFLRPDSGRGASGGSRGRNDMELQPVDKPHPEPDRSIRLGSSGPKAVPALPGAAPSSATPVSRAEALRVPEAPLPQRGASQRERAGSIARPSVAVNGGGSRGAEDDADAKSKRRYGYSRVFGDLSTFALSLSASALSAGQSNTNSSTTSSSTTGDVGRSNSVASRSPPSRSPPSTTPRAPPYAINALTLLRKKPTDPNALARAKQGGIERIKLIEAGQTADAADGSGGGGGGGKGRNGMGKSNDDDDFEEDFNPNDLAEDDEAEVMAALTWYQRMWREFVRVMITALPSLLLFPAAAVGYVVAVMQTLIRSIWRDPGNKNKRVGGRAPKMAKWFFWPLFALLVALAIAIVFYFGPSSVADATGAPLDGTLLTFLLLTIIPIIGFVVMTGSHHYWNRVPGGLYRNTYRWTIANARTMLAIFFSAVQMISFPLSRISDIYQDANRRFGNQTMTGGDNSSYEGAMKELENIMNYLVAYIPFADKFWELVLYISLAAVALWVIFLTLPVAEQLVRVWWVDWNLLAQYNGMAVDQLAGTSSEWTSSAPAASSSSAGGKPSSHLRRLIRSTSEVSITDAGKPREFDYFVGEDGQQIILPAGSRFLFRMATGRVLGRPLHSKAVHGLLQYLLGDLFYVTITSLLLRSFDCTLECTTSGGCVAHLDSMPAQVCWTVPFHQALAMWGFFAFLVYFYTASFATPLMSDVLDLNETLDIRTTPRFDIIDRVSQVVIIACYVLIGQNVVFLPVVVHTVVNTAMITFMERYKPASDRTVLLRSSLYQVGVCAAVAALTGYFRVAWLPIGFMGGGTALIALVALIRYVPLRNQVPKEDIMQAIAGLGGADIEDVDLLRVRGEERYLLKDAAKCLEKDDYEGAVTLLKRAMFNHATFVSAATMLGRITYEGHIVPRKLACCILICRLMLDSSSGTSMVSRSQKRMFQSLHFLAQCDLGLRPTVHPGKMYVTLENMRFKKDRHLADQYSLTALALLHERRALGGPMGVEEKGHMARMTDSERERLAFLCLQLAVKRWNGATAALHLARYYVEGIGTERNYGRALEILNGLAERQRFTHVYTYIGMLYLHRSHQAAKKTARQLSPQVKQFREEALAAWRKGADRGDPTCKAFLDLQNRAAAAQAASAGSGGGGGGSSSSKAATSGNSLTVATEAGFNGRRLSTASTQMARRLSNASAQNAPRIDHLSGITPQMAASAWPPQLNAPVATAGAPAPSGSASPPLASASASPPSVKPPALAFTDEQLMMNPAAMASAILLHRQNFLFRSNSKAAPAGSGDAADGSGSSGDAASAAGAADAAAASPPSAAALMPAFMRKAYLPLDSNTIYSLDSEVTTDSDSDGEA